MTPIYHDVLQGTAPWHLLRIGRVTSSRFADVLKLPRSKAAKEAGELSQTAQSYLAELIGEIKLLRAVHSGITQWEDAFGQFAWETRATRWGHEMEPLAITQYGERLNRKVDRIGFVSIDGYMLGASTDGLVGDDGIIEVKCPWNTRNHIATTLSEEVPTQYRAQVQGELWITGRQWCDFISFDPRLKPGDDLIVIRVPRDEEAIESLADIMMAFHKYLPSEPFDFDPLSIEIPDVGEDGIDWS